MATRPITDWDAYRAQLNNFVWHSGLITKPVFAAAHKNPKRIIFSEGESEKVLRAVQTVVDEGLARPIPDRPAGHREGQHRALRPAHAGRSRLRAGQPIPIRASTSCGSTIMR
ncbi:phosphate acyltransferase [Thauera humireducens]|uniref:phosphate acyltransferase n=1 Tax=Thauera humireducens TaxID=1134435 RepID=UPI00311FB3CB